MLVVLDTNVIARDFSFTGRAWRLFIEGIPRIGATFALPKIVADEAMRKFRERALQLEKDASALVATYHRLTGSTLNLPSVSAPVLAEGFETTLRKVLEQIGPDNFVLAPYPNVSHEIAVQRLLAQRKPFSSGDNGYRDYLIWETVLSIADERGDDVVFVTQNTHDFSSPDKTLHPDFDQDLVRKNLRQGQVGWCASLEEFADKFITPSMEQLSAYLESLRSNDPPINIRGWAESRLQKMLDAYDFQEVVLDVPGVSVTIDAITINNATARDAIRLPTGSIFVKCTFDVTFELSVSTDEQNYFQHEKVRELFGEAEEPFFYLSISEYKVDEPAVDVNLHISADGKTIEDAELS
jgi:hypothetical protein